ncbi:FMN reductase [Nitratireductor aestuarii]|uniref:FMN reductase n=1 Tax=Nitratireductor aestuarii TaxID=1735103 RepID=A0A916RWA7_9HYPH|nr:NAD(P)H-dependent oxidoreductase [Nitratireductor aestuarii]GGA69374.1 FMN reductase [Nitratireductor aestuarii]
MAPKLNIIIGSTRPGRVGPVIGQWVKELAEKHGKFQVELVDLVDFNLPLLDEAAHPVMQKYEHEHTKRWAASVASGDAFLFLTPEYTSFPPASLINALQVLSREWAYKPAGIVSYGGISGGLRAAQELRQMVANLNMHALPQTVPVPQFPQFINEGVFTPSEPIVQGATGLLDELYKWAVALQAVRKDAA